MEEVVEGGVQYLLATDSGQLLVFQDSALKWAAALPHPPTDVSVATFQSVSVDHSFFLFFYGHFMLRTMTCMLIDSLLRFAVALCLFCCRFS